MEQNYKNHSRLVTGFHKVLFGLLFIGLIGSLVNLFRSFNSRNLYLASLLVLLFICCFLMSWYLRAFPIKAQDRVIRMEESFRHYILTGKQIPSALKIEQIIALRFASDEEFPELAKRAENENLNSQAIKEAIKSWKADHHRM